jgi:hypothetical protein
MKKKVWLGQTRGWPRGHKRERAIGSDDETTYLVLRLQGARLPEIGDRLSGTEVFGLIACGMIVHIDPVKLHDV